jgi:hypothetical protein
MAKMWRNIGWLASVMAKIRKRNTETISFS